MTLTNEIALVTGASRGIGAAIAVQLGRQGAVVLGTATSEKGADSIARMLTDNDIRGKGYVLDVTEQSSIDALMHAIGTDFAGPSVLVNNAGITRDGLLMRMKDQDWDDIIATNLSSVFRVTKACIRDMVKARRGRIISIASVVGAMGNAGQTNYAAAKAGIIGFTKSLAREVGPRGITANAVAPGFIDTEMTRALPEDQRGALLGHIPLARLGSTEEVAATVAFLASPAAGYITGETIHVNGGMYMT